MYFNLNGKLFKHYKCVCNVLCRLTSNAKLYTALSSLHISEAKPVYLCNLVELSMSVCQSLAASFLMKSGFPVDA